MAIKKSQLKFAGTIQRGKFQPENPQGFVAHVRSYEGKPVNVTVKAKRKIKDRSDPQNRYYWGVVVKILADEWGYNSKIESEKLEIHNIIKYQFLTDPIEIKGKMLMTEISTTKLTTSEFESLMSTIREWASKEFNIYIPTPDEVPFDY